MAIKRRDLDDLSQTIFDLLTDLGSIFTTASEKADLTFIEFFYKRIDKESIMQHVIAKILPFKQQIDNRNLFFFKENRYVFFSGLPEDRVSYYIDQILLLGSSDLQMIWEYLDTMIALAESYKKCI